MVKRRSGLTLIELIIAMAIFSLAVVVALGIFTNLTKQQTFNAGQRTVQQEARELIESISRDIRGSSSVQVLDPHELIIASDQNNASIRYSHSLLYGEDDGVVYKALCLPLCTTKGERATPEQMIVDNLTFTQVNQDGQPYYKIALDAKLVTGNKEVDKATYHTETLVTVRE